MAKVLEFSVGPGGVNKHSDVVKLQEFLNEISLDEGGPAHKLHVTGIFTHETANALQEFIWFESLDDEGPEDASRGSDVGRRIHKPLKIGAGIDLDEVEEFEFAFEKLQITFSDGSKLFKDDWH